VQSLRLDADLYLPASAARVTLKVPALLWVASAEYAGHNWLLSAEYSRWDTQVKSNNAAAFPSSSGATSERAYVMGSYQVTPWLAPGMFYSLYYPNIQHRKARESQQHDIAATLRFDINPYWLVKLEGHYINGTADLQTALNNNRPKSSLANSWALFFVKTTVHF
jgi:hypothetical protein